MSEQQVVLVTGAANYWGRRVAARLLQEPDVRVIGLDTAPAESIDVDGLDYIQADIRNPLLADLLRVEGVDTVCHLAFVESLRHNEQLFGYNVMGTMKLFGACTESDVRRIIWKSSTMVYGARPDNSAFLVEDNRLNGSRLYAYNRYRCEIESFINGYRRQAPDLAITVLRFANIVGPTADTPMNTYLNNRITPMLLGFDPMLQVIHEDDVVEALAHAALAGATGSFNVAADPPMPLLRILALAGRVPLPIAHPLVERAANWLRNSRLHDLLPFEPDFLRYRWVADLTRMREVLEFYPETMGDEAVQALGVHLRMAQYKTRVADAAYDEQRLRETIERRANRADQETEVDHNG